jgi:hypothetical protein
MKFILKILQSLLVKYLSFTDKLKEYDLTVLYNKIYN